MRSHPSAPHSPTRRACVVPRPRASLFCTVSVTQASTTSPAAIATALAYNPRVLLSDEPTGELDSATAREVFGALQTANTERGVTVLVVTHDPAVSAQVRRTIAIRDGRTSSETLRHDVADAHGNATRHAVEYAVLDRAGRVQLPRDMTEALDMKDRVRLQQDADHIGVWPDRPGRLPGAGEQAEEAP